MLDESQVKVEPRPQVAESERTEQQLQESAAERDRALAQVEEYKCAVEDLLLTRTALEKALAERDRALCKLEEEVLQRTARLATVNNELDAFTYSVSHDLRGPLRHIGGFSKILIEDFAREMPPEALSHLQRIGDGVRRMGLLVDGLLNMAQVSRHDLKLQATTLNEVIEEVVSRLEPETDGGRVTWKIAELPAVKCDPVLIKQVIQKLLANALKFTRKRVRAEIEVGCADEGGKLVIFVRDNGAGFDMKYMDKLFGVFQRLHRAEDFEGTGIGLATVQRIVEKHGGRVWAEAELDKGATFYFTLAAAESTPLKANAAAELASKAAGAHV